jgi:hypothetical protein
MSRVKSQKSLGKTVIVTVSRVKTPEEVSRADHSKIKNRNSKIPFIIRGYPRLSAPIRTYSQFEFPASRFEFDWWSPIVYQLLSIGRLRARSCSKLHPSPLNSSHLQ